LKRQHIRQEIEQASRKVLIAQGPDQFSLADVALSLGMSKPNLYYYVESKDELIFSVWLGEWLSMAAKVEEAVKTCDNAPDALERMMRLIYRRYRQEPGLFRLMHMSVVTFGYTQNANEDQLKALRPSNTMLYGGIETLLTDEASNGLFPKDRDARRLVFTSHTAVIGLLTMQTLTESAGDSLRHMDEALIDDLCSTFTARCRA
jgi:AcrR family transcriptional regulator